MEDFLEENDCSAGEVQHISVLISKSERKEDVSMLPIISVSFVEVSG